MQLDATGVSGSWGLFRLGLEELRDLPLALAAAYLRERNRHKMKRNLEHWFAHEPGSGQEVLLAVLPFLLTGFLSAQENKNGKINFQFDNTEFDVPIKTVSIQKNEKIFVKVHGEKKSEIETQNVFLQFILDSLSSQKISIKDFEMKVDYSTSRFYGYIFSVRGSNAEFSTLAERFNYEVVKTDFSVNNVFYKNGSIMIAGNFSGAYSNESGKAKEKSKSEIKNGEFEVIF